MLKTHSVLPTLLAFMIGAANMVFAQEYPSRSLRIMATEVGGSGDFLLRLIVPGPQGLTGNLGQAVVIDNRTAIVSTEIVQKAPPDGYTLLVHGVAFWLGPLLQSMPYDPVNDFAPVSVLMTQPTVLVVHPSLPVKTVKDLIALAKANPGALNYASSGVGGATHLSAELFKAMAGVNITRVNFKGNGSALNDLIGGQVQVMFGNSGPVMPHVKSGRLKAIAVGSAAPSTLLPGVPTISASGVPGYESGNINAMFAPAKTPDTVIRRLNQDVVRTLNRQDIRESLLKSGSEAVGSSPEQLAAVMKADMARMGKLIKDAGIRLE